MKIVFLVLVALVGLAFLFAMLVLILLTHRSYSTWRIVIVDKEKEKAWNLSRELAQECLGDLIDLSPLESSSPMDGQSIPALTCEAGVEISSDHCARKVIVFVNSIPHPNAMMLEE